MQGLFEQQQLWVLHEFAMPIGRQAIAQQTHQTLGEHEHAHKAMLDALRMGVVDHGLCLMHLGDRQQLDRQLAQALRELRTPRVILDQVAA